MFVFDVGDCDDDCDDDDDDVAAAIAITLSFLAFLLHTNQHTPPTPDLVSKQARTQA